MELFDNGVLDFSDELVSTAVGVGAGVATGVVTELVGGDMVTAAVAGGAVAATAATTTHVIRTNITPLALALSAGMAVATFGGAIGGAASAGAHKLTSFVHEHFNRPAVEYVMPSAEINK